MEIFYTLKAVKQLKKLPNSIQERIIKKMRFYAKQDNPLEFAEHLTDYRDGEFRFRIGKYRVTFDVGKEKIYVLRIGLRDKVYD